MPQDRPPGSGDLELLELATALRPAFARLERRLGDRRYAFMRVRARDWEVRTIDGDVGRGEDLVSALAELLAKLDKAESPRTPRQPWEPRQPRTPESRPS